jgi:2,4-dienoyl-CoA reductase-like NADH-dependent reductase (Old Yellow Enzyme family)
MTDLFKPVDLGPIILRNRIVVWPTTRTLLLAARRLTLPSH